MFDHSLTDAVVAIKLMQEIYTIEYRLANGIVLRSSIYRPNVFLFVELVQGIILIDNGHEFEDEETEVPPVESDDVEENVEVNIIEKPDEPATTEQRSTPRPGFQPGADDDVDTDEVTDDETVDVANEDDDVAVTGGNGERADVEEVDDADDDGKEEEEDVLEPIDLDPRSCPTPELCRIEGRKGKGKKPKKEKKETLWRVVARGDGLFFARMHLFTDETFSKAWMYPPSLRTNDTIYAGVVLANGPAEATVSLTR